MITAEQIVQGKAIAEQAGLAMYQRIGVSKKGDSLTARQYADAEIDAFVFVSLVSGKLWVIPSSDINLNSHFKCVRSGDQYENAWHHVMETA